SATFTVGTAQTFTVTTNGFPAPTLTESGGLPTGVTFTDNGDGTAKLVGTPAAGQGGTHVLTFTASNATGTSTQTSTLPVPPPRDVPRPTRPPPPLTPPLPGRPPPALHRPPQRLPGPAPDGGRPPAGRRQLPRHRQRHRQAGRHARRRHRGHLPPAPHRRQRH